MEIDHHVGAAMSGLVADALTLVDSARVNAANHQFNYNEPMSVLPIFSYQYRLKAWLNLFLRLCLLSVKMKTPKWYSV